MKLLIILVFIVILYCLGSGAFYLTRARGHMLAKALTWRIILALLLFVFLLLANYMGWMLPHAVT